MKKCNMPRIPKLANHRPAGFHAQVGCHQCRWAKTWQTWHETVKFCTKRRPAPPRRPRSVTATAQWDKYRHDLAKWQDGRAVWPGCICPKWEGEA